MAFEFSCFLSYRWANFAIGQEAVNQLEEALAAEIEFQTPLPVFRDKRRLSTGAFLDPSLADALCKSVCMVMIYWPTYFAKDHRTCTREYLAMLELEKRRLALLNDRRNGLIVTAVVRGMDQLPAELRKGRLVEDFTNISLTGERIVRHPQFAPRAQNIAAYIAERCRTFEALAKDPCRDCATFQLPEDEEALAFLTTSGRVLPTAAPADLPLRSAM